MKTDNPADLARLADTLEALRQEIARLSERVAALEKANGQVGVPVAPAPAAAAPASAGAAPVADGSKVCRCPIAGTVAKIPIQVGQTIKVNDVLMVLEAMKMETVITAPIAGKVAKINGNVGDFVQG